MTPVPPDSFTPSRPTDDDFRAALRVLSWLQDKDPQYTSAYLGELMRLLRTLILFGS